MTVSRTDGVRKDGGGGQAENDMNIMSSRQIKMARGQMSAEWTVQLLDDDIYEGMESFEVFLTQPLVAAIDPLDHRPSVAFVDINDEEDREL